jgi:site-specific DNA-methyltransferase (adenine-specific)
MVGDRVFYNTDCVRGALDHLADASVDLIVTDPPYGIDGDRLHRHYNRDERFVIDGYVEVDRRAYNAFSRAWIAQASRVLRPGGLLYVISGYTNL